ncbi:hypothetical protein ID866_8481 [Astraeus odoratus]|nr:hypothetical protein ID866_8481 [Astraeus odoratus]
MSQILPLLGDGHGTYRVHIVGNSGVGKSTLGAELAAILNVPYIALDPIFWNPDWTPSTAEEFQAKVQQRLAASERGWVVDGNYTSKIGNVIDERRTDVVWLDPPFFLYFPRLVMRTLGRLIGRTEVCAPGCGETLKSVFVSKDSILYWAITHHSVVRRQEGENMKKWGIHVGGDMRRIGGWGRELKEWKQAVVDMVKVK